MRANRQEMIELAKRIHRTLDSIEEMLREEFGDDYAIPKTVVLRLTALRGKAGAERVSTKQSALKTAQQLKEEVKEWLGW